MGPDGLFVRAVIFSTRAPLWGKMPRAPHPTEKLPVSLSKIPWPYNEAPKGPSQPQLVWWLPFTHWGSAAQHTPRLKRLGVHIPPPPQIVSRLGALIGETASQAEPPTHTPCVNTLSLDGCWPLLLPCPCPLLVPVGGCHRAGERLCRSGWSWPMAACAAVSKPSLFRHWRHCWMATAATSASLTMCLSRPLVSQLRSTPSDVMFDCSSGF